MDGTNKLEALVNGPKGKREKLLSKLQGFKNSQSVKSLRMILSLFLFSILNMEQRLSFITQGAKQAPWMNTPKQPMLARHGGVGCYNL